MYDKEFKQLEAKINNNKNLIFTLEKTCEEVVKRVEP